MRTKIFYSVVWLAVGLMLAGCLPPGPKALVEGQRRLEEGDLNRAIERLEVAARLLPTNAHAWNYLGIAYHQAGQFTNAVRAYENALKADRNLVETRLNLGSALLDMGRPADARTEFTAYTLRRPKSGEGFERLAAAEFRLRQFTEAEANARKALQLEGAGPEAANTLGLILLQRGRATEAGQSFKSALQLQADYAPAMLNLAVVLDRHLGNRSAALEWYRRYVALEPTPADAPAVAAVIQQMEAELAPRRPAPAPTVATSNSPVTATSVKSATPPASNPPVAAASRKPVGPANNAGNPPTRAAAPAPATPVATARPEVVTLPPEPTIRTEPASQPAPAAPTKIPTSGSVASKPTAEPPAEKRGILSTINPMKLFRRKADAGVTPLPKEQEIAAAPSAPASAPAAVPAPAASVPPVASAFPRYEYRGAFTVAAGDRNQAETLLSQGNTAMRMKRYDEAVLLYRQAAQADPGWFNAQQNLTAAALESGNVSEALKAGETALALRPDSAEARYNFALALRRSNYVLDAAAQLERLLAENPDDVRAHLTAANLYAQQLRMKERARGHYRKVLELSPRHPEAGAIRYWLVQNPR